MPYSIAMATFELTRGNFIASALNTLFLRSSRWTTCCGRLQDLVIIEFVINFALKLIFAVTAIATVAVAAVATVTTVTTVATVAKVCPCSIGSLNSSGEFKKG